MARIFAKLPSSTESGNRVIAGQLANTLNRLKRNLRHNRWTVFYEGRFFIRSKRLSLALSRTLRETLDLGNLPELSAYRRPTRVSASFQQPHSSALFHSHLGRFGNAVTEVVGTIKIANLLKIPHVILEGHSVFARSGDLPSNGNYQLPSGCRVWIDFPDTPKDVHTLIHHKGSGRMLGNVDCTSTWTEAQEVFQLRFAPPEDQQTLTLHLRGGDVFGSRDVSQYGQPPFSYYRKIIDSKPWRKIQLVAEDDLNPNLCLIRNYCKTLSIEFNWRKQELQQDISILLSARNLVASRGTFAPAIAGLSRNIKVVYFFEDKFVMQPPKRGFEIWRVSDRDGQYRREILSGNWVNSDAQRALMEHYPDSKLTMEKLS